MKSFFLSFALLLRLPLLSLPLPASLALFFGADNAAEIAHCCITRLAGRGDLIFLAARL